MLSVKELCLCPPPLILVSPPLTIANTAPAFRHRYLSVWRTGALASRQRVVDVGTGTGTLARGFAGRGCQVIGIDPVYTLLAQAQQLTRDDGLTVDYRVGRAEETGLPVAGRTW